MKSIPESEKLPLLHMQWKEHHTNLKAQDAYCNYDALDEHKHSHDTTNHKIKHARVQAAQ